MPDARHLAPLLAALLVSTMWAGCLRDDTKPSPDDPAGPVAPTETEPQGSGAKDGSAKGDDADLDEARNEAKGTDNDEPGYPVCQHPWPCGDGTAWPRNLTAAETAHPRQPPAIPSDVGIRNGTVTDRDDAVTLHWGDQVTPVTQQGPAQGIPSDQQTYRTTFDVPSGLYLEASATLTWSGSDPAPPDRDATVEVRLLDENQTTVCRKSAGFGAGATGYGPTPSEITCKTGPLSSIEAPADWTVEVTFGLNTDAAERFEVDLTLDVTQPRPVFELDRLQEVAVESFDGTDVQGWIYRPDVPEGVKVPVVLSATPYPGQTQPEPGDPGYPGSAKHSHAIEPGALVQEGYAVAVFNVRGSGDSGGCFDHYGHEEQQDTAHLVDWLGNRSWSNGRVGMTGLSYAGTTAWEAAVASPDPLKTVVTSGIVTDNYSFYHTPQGAIQPIAPPYRTLLDGLATGPSVNHASQGEAGRIVNGGPVVTERVCPEVVESMTTLYQGTATDDRNPDFWSERRRIDDLPNVTTSVFLAHGFEDRWGSGHRQQEMNVWETLPDSTPKYQLEGQWAHEFPHENSYNPNWTVDDWNERLVGWFDFWLKGVGEPPQEIGTVDYQDGTGDWHETTSWPPAEAQREALHLTADGLGAIATSEKRTFRSIPDAAGSQAARAGVDEGIPGPVCSRQTPGGEPAHGLLYTSRALGQDTLVAGNPLAYLNITASQPGGLVTVTLFDLGPDFACQGATPHDALPLTTGAADLRFHEGNMQGQDFPTNTPTQVRVDLTNIAEVVPKDHKLGLLVSYGDPRFRTSQPYTPQVTVHGDSEIVVPVVDGTLGGTESLDEYPPRPFVPTSGSIGGDTAPSSAPRGEAAADDHEKLAVPSAGLGELLGGLLGGLLGIWKGGGPG